MAHKIDGPGATADNHFTEGNPSATGYVAPTQVTADWANMVQGEILAVLAAAEIAPNKADNTQMAQAIAQLIAEQAVEVEPATETVAGILKLASLAKVLEGTAPDEAVTPAGLAARTATAERTGLVQLGVHICIRLVASLTLYVSTTGSDTTGDGLTAGTPFATIQKAFDTLTKGYDLAGYTATIQLADGTYTVGVTQSALITGQQSPSSVVLQGNAATPSNTIISTTNASAVVAQYSGAFTVKNVKLQTTTAGLGLASLYGGKLFCGPGLIFGACAGGHVVCTKGLIVFGYAYLIAGSAPIHWQTDSTAEIYAVGLVITITGTPAFSNAFAVAADVSVLMVYGCTFTGSATGKRYDANTNGVINTGGGGANYLPGSITGTYASGGQYV